jgi:putative transport protein
VTQPKKWRPEASTTSAIALSAAAARSLADARRWIVEMVRSTAARRYGAMQSHPFILAAGRPVAADLAVLALAVAVGLALGGIRLRSLKLGLSGVLFSSLLFGQVGFSIDAKVLEFLRDFALVVFMYAIGLQVGPGFGASLRADGLRLNAMSLCVIVLGALMTAGLVRLVPHSMAPGLYAGAFSTTAGLAAAQEALRDRLGEGAAARTGLAYSIAYPVGIVGPMIVILMLRLVFRVRLDRERSALADAEEAHRRQIETVDIEVTAAKYAGRRIADHPLLRGGDVVFTRVLHEEVVTVPTGDTLLQVGDVYRAIGPRERLAELVAALGRRSGADFSKAHGDVQRMDLLVTRTQVLHRSLHELDLVRRTGVTIAHVNRAGVELIPTGSLRLAFGDQVVAVGPAAGLRQAEAELGNSVQRLNQSQLIPIFLGIVLGVLVGSIPLVLPGVHGSIRIGLAGGSLIAAIALSRLGSLGSIVWHMPAAANQLFRDFGLAIFLACVGIQAGDHFVQRAVQNSGVALLAWGALISIIPVFAVACFARLALRMNFVSLTGWVAGAMGSSTTLLFAQEMTSSNAPAVSYATVLPLAELMPIICVQFLALTAAAT